MVEIWKDIESYEGLYSVSNLGRIRANKRIIYTITGPRQYKERILIPEKTTDGHLRVTLSKAGLKERIFVHRLVAQAFLPNELNYPIINHKDENPANNCVENLEWCTYAYNNAYNNRHERVGDAEGHDISVFDLEYNYVESYPSITKAAKAYNIKLTTLWRYVKSKKPIKKHYFVEQL